MPEPWPESGIAGPRAFATTHWSVVLAAGRDDSASSQGALETLCRACWYPIYVYVRRKGHAPDDAQDLTQEFFAQLITKQHLRRADREKGKFRTFLLAMLDCFLAREWRDAHRQKRGGGLAFVSLDQQLPEQRYRLEPVDATTPEKTFLRAWALAVLQRTMEALERECEAGGKGHLFREVRSLLAGERDGRAYAGISERVGLSAGALRVTVHRLRQRYGDLLRGEIAQTVAGSQEVEEEMRYLLTALRQ